LLVPEIISIIKTIFFFVAMGFAELFSFKVVLTAYAVFGLRRYLFYLNHKKKRKTRF